MKERRRKGRAERESSSQDAVLRTPRCFGKMIAMEKIQKHTLASRRAFLHLFIHTNINDMQIQTPTETATDEGHKHYRGAAA